MTTPRKLLVRRIDTDEIVHELELVGDKSERQIEKVKDGLYRKVDLDRFYVDDTGEP